MSNKIQLETEVQEFAKATANPPFLADLGPEKGRAVVGEVQSSPIEKPDADIEELTIDGGPNGQGSLRIVSPTNAVGDLPASFNIKERMSVVEGQSESNREECGGSGQVRQK